MPSNLTSDKKYVSLAGSTNATFKGNAAAVGRPDLLDDPRFATNNLRVENAAELDKIFGNFIATHTLDEVVEAFDKAKGTVAPQNVVPRFTRNPGSVKWTAKGLGADNDAVFEKVLGLSKNEIKAYRERGII